MIPGWFVNESDSPMWPPSRAVETNEVKGKPSGLDRSQQPNLGLPLKTMLGDDRPPVKAISEIMKRAMAENLERLRSMPPRVPVSTVVPEPAGPPKARSPPFKAPPTEKSNPVDNLTIPKAIETPELSRFAGAQRSEPVISRGNHGVEMKDQSTDPIAPAKKAPPLMPPHLTIVANATEKEFERGVLLMNQLKTKAPSNAPPPVSYKGPPPQAREYIGLQDTGVQCGGSYCNSKAPPPPIPVEEEKEKPSPGQVAHFAINRTFRNLWSIVLRLHLRVIFFHGILQ